MNTLEFDTQVVKIYSNEQLNYVLIEWLSPTVYIEYVNGCERFAKVVEAKKANNVIYNIRLLGALSDESIHYTNTKFIPLLLSLNIQKSAIIIPEDVLDKMIFDNMMDNLVTGPDLPASNQYFNSLTQAEAWLKE